MYVIYTWYIIKQFLFLAFIHPWVSFPSYAYERFAQNQKQTVRNLKVSISKLHRIASNIVCFSVLLAPAAVGKSLIIF